MHRALAGLLLLVAAARSLVAAPTHLVNEPPVSIREVAPGVMLVDFGRVAFGNLELTPPADTAGTVTVHFGEAMARGRIDRQPPGTVRYGTATATWPGAATRVVAPPADARNTRQLTGTEQPDWNGFITPPAVLTPANWGVLVPFRWVEIEGWPGALRPEQLRRRAAYASTWDDDAAAFRSSDDLLNRIWELCRYSIKATTFAGVYVDGDRERIPYEADAYLNQLSHYAVDHDVQMARDTYDHLMKHPTWPSEWATHLVFMVHADWMHTGDRAWLAERYEALKGKLLLERVRGDGLVASEEKHWKKLDLVDWPAAERDGFVFTPANAVINAFFVRGLEQMAELARALGREADAEDYAARAAKGRAAYHRAFFDPVRGLFRDGTGTEHTSLHANLFPLAFGLAPEGTEASIARWLQQRGMACSVYAAQYLMEALFTQGRADDALGLMLAEGDRSWQHMVNSGTTITWEAWDQRYKPNQDWNHAWGAAPANLLPRFVLGVTPSRPGWSQITVRPFAGNSLQWCEGVIPTPRGAVRIRWQRQDHFELTLDLPAAVTAQVEIPAGNEAEHVLINGQQVEAERAGNYWRIRPPVSGTAHIKTIPNK